MAASTSLGTSSASPNCFSATEGGCAANFAVEIYEAVDSPPVIGIKTRGWSFRFALSSRDDVVRMVSFLREYTGQLVFSEMVVGSFRGASVWLIKDNEFADRFWLRAWDGVDMVEFTFVADTLTEFTEGVARAADDLRE